MQEIRTPLLAVFVSLFVLDVVTERPGFWATTIAFLLHLIPTAIVPLPRFCFTNALNHRVAAPARFPDGCVCARCDSRPGMETVPIIR